MNHNSVVEKQKNPTEELFYELHQEDVLQLIGLANLPAVQESSLQDLVSMTQKWAKGDHYDPEFPIEQNITQMEQSLQIFHNLGLLQEIEPQGGVYDQILILGGEQNSNHIRIDYALKQLSLGRASLSTNGSLVCLGGDRMLKVRELEAVGLDIKNISTNLGNDNPWSKILLKSEMIASMNEETAMRVALTARLGVLNLSEKHIRLDSSSTISHNVFRKDSSIPNIVTVFAPKIDRPLGEARHTTESTVLEWVNALNPEMGSRILFVTNAPYTIRTAKNFYSIVQSIRPDLKLDYCGAEAANDNLLVRRCYGELARLLYEDSKILT